MKFASTIILALLLVTAVPTSAFATGSLTKKPVLIMGGHTIKAGGPTKKPWWILGGHADEAGGPTKKPGLTMGGHTDEAEGKAKDGTPGSTFALDRRSGGAVAVAAILIVGAIFRQQGTGMGLPSVRGLWKALCSAMLSQYFEFVLKVLLVGAVGRHLIKKGVEQADEAAKQRIDQASENLDQITEKRIDQADEAAKQRVDQASENLDRITEKRIDQADEAAKQRIDQASENLQGIVNTTILTC